MLFKTTQKGPKNIITVEVFRLAFYVGQDNFLMTPLFCITVFFFANTVIEGKKSNNFFRKNYLLKCDCSMIARGTEDWTTVEEH